MNSDDVGLAIAMGRAGAENAARSEVAALRRELATALKAMRALLEIFEKRLSALEKEPKR